MSSNQAEFSEHEFPFRNRRMIDQFLSDNSTDILYQHASDVKWEPYNKLHVATVQFKASGSATKLSWVKCVTDSNVRLQCRSYAPFFERSRSENQPR